MGSSLKLVRIILWLLTGAVVVAGLVWFGQYRRLEHTMSKNETYHFKIQLESLLTSFQDQTGFVFDQVFNQEPVLALIHEAWNTTDESVRDSCRTQLNRMLTPAYKNLTKYNFRQVHFHFPNTVTFLRMHRPQRYGDSLEDVRPTVVAVNRERKPVVGFEEGRTFNGFRFLYPLEYQSEYIGSVEISLSFAALGSNLAHIFDNRFQFLLSRKVVEAKVLPSEISNYSPWPLDDAYLLDVGVSNFHLGDDCDGFEQILKMVSKIKELMTLEEDFSLPYFCHETSYLLQFLSVDNYSGYQVAYLVGVQEFPEFHNKRQMIMTRGVVLGTLFFICLVVVFFLEKTAWKIKEYRRFLPICSACKKVREIDSDATDPDNWISIEEHFSRQGNSRLTHGLCPTCVPKFLEDI